MLSVGQAGTRRRFAIYRDEFGKCNKVGWCVHSCWLTDHLAELSGRSLARSPAPLVNGSRVLLLPPLQGPSPLCKVYSSEGECTECRTIGYNQDDERRVVYKDGDGICRLVGASGFAGGQEGGRQAWLHGSGQ